MVFNNDISLIKLNVGDKYQLDGSKSEILSINNYKIEIPYQLVKIGYEIIDEKYEIRIKAKDNSYECVVIQLSDNYIKPTDKEIDDLYNLDEYKINEENYDKIDDMTYETYYEKKEEIFTNYFKKLGYTAKNSPNYVLTRKELDSVTNKYYKDKEELSSSINTNSSGTIYTERYNWGEAKIFAVSNAWRKHDQNDIIFSVFLYMFEYYDSYNNNYGVDIWTL